MINRTVRTKLDYVSRIEDQSNKEKKTNERDRLYKEKIKQNAENKNTKENNFNVGDQVFVEQAKRNKWSAPYEQDIYIIYRIDGSTVLARRKRDGKEVSRDSSKFRLAQLSEEQKAVISGSNMGHHDRRDTILRKSKRPNRIQVPDEGASQQEETQDDDNRKETQEETDEGDVEPQVADDEAESREEQQPRRSDRTRQRPKHLNDYIMSYHT